MPGISESIQITSLPVVFEPVGRCIYCGVADSDLRREHIIPFGLGGNLILPKASCRKCERLTCRIETHVLKSMFGKFRQRMGLPTRNPKDRPSHLDLEVQVAEAVYEIRRFPAKEYPRHLFMPRFISPGILAGRPRTETMHVEGIWCLDVPGELPPNTTFRGGQFRPDYFCVMLAKIGHAMTIASYGWDIKKRFRPLLPRLILEQTLDGHVVGGIPDLHQKPAPDTAIHQLDLFEQDHCLVVSIRLFAHLGTPVYYAVFGQRSMMA